MTREKSSSTLPNVSPRIQSQASFTQTFFVMGPAAVRTPRTLERSQDSLPSSESAGLLSTAEQLLGQLESALQPDGVRRFLSAVARGGASVESLTPEVMKWLEGHESVNRFRIVAGQPVEGPGE